MRVVAGGAEGAEAAGVVRAGEEGGFGVCVDVEVEALIAIRAVASAGEGCAFGHFA